MARALYRKYRSKNLSEVVGQKHITDVLQKSLDKGLIAHAYLLTGPRGVGKTSIARILAHEINKLPYDGESNHLDIIEIDAASNNGVDNIRDLRDKARIAPVSASKKIYIIDEVHMLSKSAFNALLKTLEEPPEHVVFILATTDADKLPETIISRTQRFSFRAIPQEVLAEHLGMIAKAEGIPVDDEALRLIAMLGDGSFRDSISLLDQLSGLSEVAGGITAELVQTTLGLAPSAVVEAILSAVERRDIRTVVQTLDESAAGGIQSHVLAAQIIDTLRLRIADSPQHVRLLDQLLDVGQASRPDIKLLVTLVAAADEKQPAKSAALSVSMPGVSAPVDKLQTEKPKRAPAAKPAEESRQGPVHAPSGPESAPAELDWNALVDHARSRYVAVYSVLAKCSHEYTDGTLRIYTGNAFYKKKLDSGKHRADLMQSLADIGAGGAVIETISGAAPPKDLKAAAVAAIMGGGEEVNVDL